MLRAIQKKHFPNGANLVTNILDLKYPPNITSDHSEMAYFFKVVRIYRSRYISKNKDHGTSWDLGVITTSHFQK